MAEETPTPDELIARLRRIGLAQDAAAVYVHLLRLGPCKASQVAAAAKLSRPEAYRALEELAQLGFATSSLGRPARFEAAPSDTVFRQLRANLRERENQIRDAETVLREPLERLRNTPDAALKKHRFNLLNGWDSIQRRMHRLVADARHELALHITHPGLAALVAQGGGWERILSRTGEGVHVRVLASPQTASPNPQLIGHPIQLETRESSAKGPIAVALADREQVLVLSSDSNGSGTPVAFWSDAALLAGTHAELFDAAWHAAQNGANHVDGVTEFVRAK